MRQPNIFRLFAFGQFISINLSRHRNKSDIYDIKGSRKASTKNRSCRLWKLNSQLAMTASEVCVIQVGQPDVCSIEDLKTEIFYTPLYFLYFDYF